DGDLDILAGLSGTLLSLLHHYRFNPASFVLERVEECAALLTDSWIQFRRGRRSTLYEFLGFAHGASGVLLSISETSKLLDDPHIDDVASEMSEVIRDGIAGSNDWSKRLESIAGNEGS